jgi:hypothetical protein
MGDPDSSFDICFYYTRENPDEDALGTPSNGSSGTPDTTVFGDVFKAFDEPYDTPPASHFSVMMPICYANFSSSQNQSATPK